MKCPKCHYIGFDSGHRCRNCGYEFSLAVEEARPFEVTIAREEPGPGRMPDLALSAFNARLTPAEPLDAAADPAVEEAPVGRHGGADVDLPLFTTHVVDDQAPLVTPPAVPRAPLSVRRAGPPRGRVRVPPPEPSLDLGLSEPAMHQARDDAETDPWTEVTAGVPRRLAAGIVDVTLLGTITIVVVYLTLRVANVPLDEWRMLPMAPLVAFLLLLCGGYFIIFTAAGGQTIGKMVARIRVVNGSDDPPGSRSVAFGAALVRAVICFCSVVALGAGFLPVLVRSDRRALHDRIADTRVVSA